MKRKIATISLSQAALPLFNWKKIQHIQYHRSDSNQGSDYIAIFVTPPHSLRPPPPVRSLQDCRKVMFSVISVCQGVPMSPLPMIPLVSMWPLPHGDPLFNVDLFKPVHFGPPSIHQYQHGHVQTCSRGTTPHHPITYTFYVYIGKQVVGHQLIINNVFLWFIINILTEVNKSHLTTD